MTVDAIYAKITTDAGIALRIHQHHENNFTSAQLAVCVSVIFKKTVCLLCLLVALVCSNSICFAGTCQGTDGSAYWSTLAHEENSVIASVIYIPYLLLQIPVRIIDAIVDPKPTSKATMPPQAHKGPSVLR